MKKFLTTITLVFFGISTYAQIYVGNFYGKDSEEINGNFHYEIPLGFPIPIKKFERNNTKLIVAPYYTYSETFIGDNWVFETDGNNTVAFLDPDPSHEYKASLFSFQSKIRSWSWQAWFGVQTTLNKVGLSLYYIPTFLQVGSFRRKYTDANEIVKTVDRFKDKADFYNINRFQHRVYGSVSVYGVGIGAYANLTSFFKSNRGPELSKFGITLVIRDNLGDFILRDDDKEDRDKPEVKQMRY